MMKIQLKALLALAALVAVGLCGAPAEALTFTALGNLSLTGTVDLGGGAVPFAEQAPGSSLAAYNETIEVATDDFLSPTTISILGGSLLVSQDYPGGPLLPAPDGGPAAGDPGIPTQANYGIELDAGFAGVAYAAVRGLEWSLSAPAVPVVAGTFSSLSQTLAATAGTFDVNTPPALGGSASSDPIDTVIDNTAGDSIYVVNGSTAILLIPFLAVAPGDLTLEYAGTIVATATVPEPTSCLLVGIGLVAIAGLSRRKM